MEQQREYKKAQGYGYVKRGYQDDSENGLTSKLVDAKEFIPQGMFSGGFGSMQTNGFVDNQSQFHNENSNPSFNGVANFTNYSSQPFIPQFQTQPWNQEKSYESSSFGL